MRFTHDRELSWLLPGMGATHRPLEVLAVTVWRTKVTRHRALWDHAGLLDQLRLDLTRPVRDHVGGLKDGRPDRGQCSESRTRGRRTSPV